MTLAIGSRLGAYEIVSSLGAGGMGAVYRGLHVETGEEVALKTVLVAQANELAAIRTEIQALRRLDHPGIVRILDAGVDAGLPWYAMELLHGSTMQQFQRTFWSEWRASSDAAAKSASDLATMTHQTGASGPVLAAGRVMSGAPAGAGRLREALTLARRLCSPLAYLHQLGIVHRDLKPGNVFVRPDGRPVLMDFGLVSRFGAAGRDVLEIAGTLAGTAYYMAPEQVLRQRVDARTDLYALGCILFELVTGRPPFWGDSIGDILQQHLTSPPLPASRFATDVPASLDELLLALLAKRVRDRIGHADDVAAWLEHLGADVDEAAVPSSTVRPAYLYRPELAGRDDVLDTLNRHVHKLLGGVGGCVLLGGESGVGKTSIVGEVARAATLQHLVVVAGECQPTGGGVLHPLIPLIGRIIDRAVEGGPTVAAALFGQRAKVLAAIEPAVGRLPGFSDSTEAEDLPPDAARDRLLADVRETVAAFAEEHPVLLVLDDLQWADALTLQFLLSTANDFFERNALLVVGTFRSDEQPQALRDVLSLPTIARIEVGRLSAGAIGAMVGDMLALADPPKPFVDFVATHSEGNPFFVAEYLRTAVAERLLYRTGGRWVFGDGAIDDGAFAQLAPPSLRELIARRLAGLPASAHQLAQIAAVLGREVDAVLLLAAAGMPEADAMEAIRELGVRQVIDSVEGGRYRFVHDKLREMAYESIPAQQRITLHRRAAGNLEAVYGDTTEFPRFYGALGLHYERAGERAKAIDYFEKASEQAAKAFADREVVNYLTAALRLDDEQGRRVEPSRRTGWRTAIGMGLRGLGEIERGRSELEQSLRELGYPVPTGSSAAAAARHVCRELMFRRSLKAPPVLPRVSSPEAERALDAYNYVAMIAYHQSDVLGQVFCTFAAMKLAPRVGPSHPAAQLYGAAGNILGYFGLRKIAFRYARLSHEIARATGQGVSLGLVHQMSGHLAGLLGDLETFDSDIRYALDTYTRIGHHRYREEALTNIAHIQGLRGELAASLETFREIERSARARDDQQTTGWGMLGQARMTAMLGCTEEALTRYGESVAKGRDDLSALEGFAGRAVVRAQLGDAAGARDDVERTLAVMQQASTTSYTSIWAYSNALEALFLADSDPPFSRADAALAAHVIGRFRAFVRMIPLARPRLELWNGVLEWRHRRQHRAERSWTRALDGAGRMNLTYDRALAHFWIGRCKSGHEGRPHLLEALESFERMQAGWHAAAARRLLDTGAAKE